MFGSLALSLGDIFSRSFAVKTRVMGHFVDLNCAERKQCAVSVMICLHRFCELAKALKEAVSWWQTRDRNCLLCQCN